MLKVFAGYDPRIPQGLEVFRHSVERHATTPVAVIPLNQETLRAGGWYTRGEDERASTPFSLTRFLVPALCNFEGWAIFCDGSDMLVTRDIAELLDHAKFGAAVSCVEHDYTPNAASKFLRQKQEAYPRKNWSSVMVFDCSAANVPSVGDVERMEPSWLHQMAWADSCLIPQPNIGELPMEWNWLAGEEEYQWNKPTPPALIHYTLGLPCVPGATKTQFDDLWYVERQKLLDAIFHAS